MLQLSDLVTEVQLAPHRHHDQHWSILDACRPRHMQQTKKGEKTTNGVETKTPPHSTAK